MGQTYTVLPGRTLAHIWHCHAVLMAKSIWIHERTTRPLNHRRHFVELTPEQTKPKVFEQRRTLRVASTLARVLFELEQRERQHVAG